MIHSTTVGTLYLVSTPIGNMEDITLRAIQILKDVETVAAEDTRRTGILLKHYKIHNRLESYHDHNKERKTDRLLSLLLNGHSVAVVSDAGTPGISDPAYYLVKAAIKSHVPVVSIPGATAVIAGLVSSGLPTDRFVFEGFLPVKKGRRKRLSALKEEHRTIILYEAPHRLLRTLSDIKEFLGNRSIAVCRELTKKYEEIIRGSTNEIIEEFSCRKIRGEFVIIIQGYSKICQNNTKNQYQIG